MSTQKTAIIFDHIMALDHSRSGLENKSGRIFSFDMFTLQNLAKNLGACKPTFHTFYTSHLRWNSTMRRCFYQTDLRQNAVFHNFSRKIALIQYSTSKHALAFSETVQKISKITYTASLFSLLTSAKFAVNIKRVTLQHKKEFILFIFYLMVL